MQLISLKVMDNESDHCAHAKLALYMELIDLADIRIAKHMKTALRIAPNERE